MAAEISSLISLSWVWIGTTMGLVIWLRYPPIDAIKEKEKQLHGFMLYPVMFMPCYRFMRFPQVLQQLL